MVVEIPLLPRHTRAWTSFDGFEMDSSILEYDGVA